MEPVRSDIEECNIGTDLKPIMIKISKTLTQQEKEKYITLLKEYQDVLLGVMRISNPMIPT